METKLPEVEDYTSAGHPRQKAQEASGDASAMAIISQGSTDSERVKADLPSGRQRSTTMALQMKRKPQKEVHFENIGGQTSDGIQICPANGSMTAEPRDSPFLHQFTTDFIPGDKLRDYSEAIQDSDGKYAMSLIKQKDHNIEKMKDIGWDAIRSLKYTKKIDGPTMFQDETDAEKPPWKFLHDQIFAPTLNHKYQSVLKRRRDEIQRMVAHSLKMEKQKKIQKSKEKSSLGLSLMSSLGGKGRGQLSFPSSKSVNSSSSKSPMVRRAMYGKQPSGHGITGSSTFKQAVAEQKSSDPYMTVGSSDSKSGLKTVKEKADELLETKESNDEESPKKSHLTQPSIQANKVSQSRLKLAGSNLDNLSQNSRSRKSDQKKKQSPTKGENTSTSAKAGELMARMRRGTQLEANLSQNSESANAFTKVQQFLKNKFHEKKIEQNLLNKVLNMQRPKPPLPDYIKNSPRWRKIERLNNDLHDVSANFARYVDYLNKVKIQIRRDKEEDLILQREEAEQEAKMRKINMQQEVINASGSKPTQNIPSRVGKATKEQRVQKQAIGSRRRSEPNGAPPRKLNGNANLQHTATIADHNLPSSLFSSKQFEIKKTSTIVMEDQTPSHMTTQQPSSFEVSQRVSQEVKQDGSFSKTGGAPPAQERFFKSNKASFISKENLTSSKVSPAKKQGNVSQFLPIADLRRQLNTQGGRRPVRRVIMSNTSSLEQSRINPEVRLGTSPIQGHQDGNISFRNYTDQAKTVEFHSFPTSISQPIHKGSPTNPGQSVNLFDDKRVQVNRRLRQINYRLEQLESSIAARDQNIVNTASFLDEMSKSSKMEMSTFRKKAHNSVCYGQAPALFLKRICKTPATGNSLKCKEAMARVLNGKPFRHMPTQEEALSSMRTENPLTVRSRSVKKE